MTWFGLPTRGYPANVIVGAAMVALLAGSVLAWRRGAEGATKALAGAAAVLYGILLLGEQGFVSGALVATPLAGLAFVASRRTTGERILLTAAIAATGLTWAFQILGGAGPQWGGRYLLAPTLVLTALGAAALPRGAVLVRRTVIGTSVAVTLFGTLWIHSRAQQVDDFFAHLAERPEDVVVSTNGFLEREAGPAYLDRSYPSLGRGVEQDDAVVVLESMGPKTSPCSRSMPNLAAEPTGSTRIDFLVVPLWLHSYDLEP